MTNALTLHPKVAGSLIAGYLATIIVYSLHQWAHVDLPDYVSGALVGLLAAFVGWLVPSPPAPAA